MKYKILSLVFVLCLFPCLCLFTACNNNQPATAVKIDGVTYRINEEKNEYYVYSYMEENPLQYGTADLIIKSEINGLPVTAVNASFKDCQSLASITFPNSIMVIDTDGIFANCYYLKSVTLPRWTANIGVDAFYNCQSLSSIDIPCNVQKIYSRAFGNCYSLKTVNFSRESLLTDIGDRAFYNCVSLTSITIPVDVKTIGSRAFEECSSLNNVVFINEETKVYDDILTDYSNLESIGWSAFAHCTSLINIVIPREVTYIGAGAFSGCDALMNATFEETYGWTYSSENIAIEITSSDIYAAYLTDTYSQYNWNRTF